MLVYLLVVALILFFKFSLNKLSQETIRKKKEEMYLRIVCLILVLLAALRGSSVGTDTVGYIEEYHGLSSWSFADILLMKADFPGYYLLAKSCSVLHFPVQVLFGIVEGIYVYSIYKFAVKLSEDKLYTILCFEMIGLYAFSLAGLKQTLSMAFVLLFSLEVTDKNYVRAVLYAIIAYLCHHASLIFLFGVALYFIRNWKIYYWTLAGLVAFSLFGTSSLWTNLIEALNNEHYTELYMEDEGYSSTTMIFYGVLLFFQFVFSRNYSILKKEESRVILGMSALAFAFQAFSFVSSAAFRLSFFFLPFMIVGFPNCFHCMHDKEFKGVIKFLVISMIIVFFVYSNKDGGSVVPYKFFWQ